MRIAIVGTGISGLTAAWKLHERHELTLFEAADYVGGHTNTIDVCLDGERHSIDTGFIVFNERTYPNFIALLDELHVASQPTSMGFSVRCDRTGLEYMGSHLNGLFAQRRNLVSPGFYRMLRDIVRFNREAVELLDDDATEITVSDYLASRAYSAEFIEHYLLPMGSAIWSCPRGLFARFPMRFIVEFYRNHGLLQITGRPAWRVIQGGSRTYVERLIAPFRRSIRLKTPVLGVRRHGEGVAVTFPGGTEHFDHVIFACHGDQALRILADPSPIERETLRSFPYESNLAILHTDTSVLPRRRRAWAAWNYRLTQRLPERATVTYQMNILQGLTSRNVFCVTLNDEEGIQRDRIIRRIEYRHPVYTLARAAAQRRHPELVNSNWTSYCGAYWGNGFHEDGVVSALAVCRAIDTEGTSCTAPFTRVASGTVDSRPFGTNSVIGCS
jgi:uncharacterized protein